MALEQISCPSCDRSFRQETRFLQHLTNDHAVEDHLKLYLDMHCGGVHPTCQCSPDCQEKLTWSGWRRGFLTNRVRGHVSRLNSSLKTRRRGRPGDLPEARTSVAVNLAKSLRSTRTSFGRRLPNPVEILASARLSQTTHDGKIGLIESSTWSTHPTSPTHSEELSTDVDSIAALVPVDGLDSSLPADVVVASQPATKPRRRKSPSR